MKITLESYNPEWVTYYANIKKELESILSFLHPTIEHIGSTSVEGLTAKPIIDIIVGLSSEHDFDKIITPLVDNHYIYYEKYNSVMPHRRFFAKLKTKPATVSVQTIYKEDDTVPNELHDCKIAHIHLIVHNSPSWFSYITFRDYLRCHNDIKNQYQQLKIGLSNLEWRDGNHYSEAKNDFISEHENQAVQWYATNKKTI